MKIRKESPILPSEDFLPETQEPMFSKQFIEQLSLIFFDDE